MSPFCDPLLAPFSYSLRLLILANTCFRVAGFQVCLTVLRDIFVRETRSVKLVASVLFFKWQRPVPAGHRPEVDLRLTALERLFRLSSTTAIPSRGR